MVLLLATFLAAAPVQPVQAGQAGGGVHLTARSAQLRTQFDVWGMVASYWYLPQSRVDVDAVIDNARGLLAGDATLNGQGLLRVTPIVGPWMAASSDHSLNDTDRLILCATGMMQFVGLTIGTIQLFRPTDPTRVATGPVLRVSPIAAGRIGLSVKIFGF